MKKKHFFTYVKSVRAVFMFLFALALLGPSLTHASGKRKGKDAFDPTSVNIESVQNDEEFARLLPEYSMRFTGLLDRELEISFSYMVPSQDGVLKIVQNEGVTRNWVKNPVLFEFASDFFDRVPTGDRLKPNEIDFVSQQDMFTLAIGGVPDIKREDWSLEVKGLVEKPAVFSYEDLLDMPQISVYATLETISNPPGGRLIGNAVWTGVPLRFIFQKVGSLPAAQELVFRCEDGYSTSITVEKALEEGVMLALKINGEKLQGEHGYPLRAVVPEKYGMKWAKWITEIEFVDYDYRGFWEKRGWSDYAGRDRPDKRYD